MIRKKPQRTLWLVQLHYVGFVALWVAWTVALLAPVPKQTASVVLPTDEAKFWFGKSLHVCTYAFLTIAGISLPWSRKQRLGLLLALFLHGVATEILQQFVPGRTGSVRDVLLDSAGILLGWAILSWWVMRRNRARRS
jgi:VanZ family protein